MANGTRLHLRQLMRVSGPISRRNSSASSFWPSAKFSDLRIT